MVPRSSQDLQPWTARDWVAFDSEAPPIQTALVSGRAEQDNADLLRRANAGDDQAWRSLVDSHAALVWSIIRTFAIGRDAHDDVFQAVWLRLAESMDGIRQPDRLASWLARVARNEAIGVYRSRQRVAPHEDVGQDLHVTTEPAAALMVSETQQVVRAALDRLGGRCQRLLTMLVASPPLTYEEVSELLDLPIGSIGPTRARCLEKLERTVEIRGLINDKDAR